MKVVVLLGKVEKCKQLAYKVSYSLVLPDHQLRETFWWILVAAVKAQMSWCVWLLVLACLLPLDEVVQVVSEEARVT